MSVILIAFPRLTQWRNDQVFPQLPLRGQCRNCNKYFAHRLPDLFPEINIQGIPADSLQVKLQYKKRNNNLFKKITLSNFCVNTLIVFIKYGTEINLSEHNDQDNQCNNNSDSNKGNLPRRGI